MRRFARYCLLFAAALILSTGCFSYSTLHTATPIEEGQTETTLSAGYFGVAVDAGSGTEPFDLPSTEAAMRYGVTTESDLGFKIFPLGFAFDYNHAVVNTEDFVLSVNPYLSVTRFGAGSNSLTYGVALMNVLADVVKSDIATVTVGLKPGWIYGIGSTEAESDIATGGVIGGMAGVKVAMGDEVSVMPSIDVLTPFDDVADVWFYTAGVAVMF